MCGVPEHISRTVVFLWLFQFLFLFEVGIPRMFLWPYTIQYLGISVSQTFGYYSADKNIDPAGGVRGGDSPPT